MFERIDATFIHSMALKTDGAAGSFGIDTYGWRQGRQYGWQKGEFAPGPQSSDDTIISHTYPQTSADCTLSWYPTLDPLLSFLDSMYAIATLLLVHQLSNIASTQPHAAHAATTHGLINKWSFL